ncbi:hypothetical protein J2X57_000078 [Luteibacter sp. 1214]|uniref:MobA/MobL family protein n=1 Tax=Luteibacter sp. 1214 TaxID=2817735 RepID=UPI00285E5D16|nr:MobA/MobL family protein [Luteibacter sp. 1214]MDR6640884.1 hypothetical protein [Luteibacter sp. 1214]
MRHARPHLEVHSRSKGHSAVAGAAYRLGLKLKDERTGLWHDYTRRAAGEEIVFATTVAPEGAPSWASDPAQLWNWVESVERRKDAQVARDYRIPIPLGLDDRRAGQLAERLARFIMCELSTPVSVGLHRDASVDLFGDVKPQEKQGYHAHLYFPSRPLLVSVPDGEDQEAASTATFGPRHPMLISRKLGRGMVEMFNRTWAEMSTEAAADAGIDAQYDHRSYVRMGLPIEPQPTLGAEATALERKGFFTRKGDAVREIVVMSKVYEAAHAEVAAAQQDQARSDVARERLAGVEAERPAPMTRTDAMPGKFDFVPSEPATGSASPQLAEMDARPALSPDAALVERFTAIAPHPASADDDARWGAWLRLVRTLQRALAVLRELGGRRAEHEGRAERATAAKLEAEYELDEARRRRIVASERAARWARDHRFRMFAAKWATRGKPKAWRELAAEVTHRHHAVQEMEAAVRFRSVRADDLKRQAAAVAQREQRANVVFRRTVEVLANMPGELMPPLLAAMNPVERAAFEEVSPLPAPPPDVPTAPVAQERLDYRPPIQRARP